MNDEIVMPKPLRCECGNCLHCRIRAVAVEAATGHESHAYWDNESRDEMRVATTPLCDAITYAVLAVVAADVERLIANEMRVHDGDWEAAYVYLVDGLRRLVGARADTEGGA